MGKEKRTPTIWRSAKKGYVNFITLHLNAGASPDAIHPNGTPLFLSAQEGHLECVKVLCAAGANPSMELPGACDMRGRSALEIAAEKGFVEILRTMLNHAVSSKETSKALGKSLFYAVKEQNEECVRVILSKEVEVDPLRSMVCLAARNGNLKILKILIESGFNINERDINGMTPLEEAAAAGKADCLSFILAQGGARDLEAVSSGPGRTPLLAASEHAHIECMRILLEAGADPNAKCSTGSMRKGNTPLTFVAGAGFCEGVRLILEAGGSADIATTDGDTPISLCAHGGHVEAAKLLLEKTGGEGLDWHDMKGRTLLMRAASYGRLEMCKFLVSAGVNVHEVDEDGLNAANHAGRGRWEGNTETKDYLTNVIQAQKERDFFVSDMSDVENAERDAPRRRI